jgi:hypothetical protein
VSPTPGYDIILYISPSKKNVMEEEKKEVKLVTKGTDELMFGWKLEKFTNWKAYKKYYYKYGLEDKGVTLTSNKPLS